MSDDQERTAEQERAEASEATDRKHGEHILAAVEASDKARQGPDPLLEVLRQAHRARVETPRGPDAA
jgi:hypothetical protein